MSAHVAFIVNSCLVVDFNVLYLTDFDYIIINFIMTHLSFYRVFLALLMGSSSETVIVSSISYGRQCKEKCDKNKCGVNDDGNEKLNLH